MSDQPVAKGRTRALNPLGALAFVRTHHPQQLDAVLAALAPQDLVALGAVRNAPKLKAMSWVPFALQVRLLRAIDNVVGNGDLSVLYDVGDFMGRRDVPRMFSAFLKFGNPGWMMEIATKLWRLYHDQGHWELRRSPVNVIATLHDHHENDVAFCAVFQAWIRAAIEVSGGQEVMGAHPICAARQNTGHCVFTIRWQDPLSHKSHK